MTSESKEDKFTKKQQEKLDEIDNISEKLAQVLVDIEKECVKDRKDLWEQFKRRNTGWQQTEFTDLELELIYILNGLSKIFNLYEICKNYGLAENTLRSRLHDLHLKKTENKIDQPITIEQIINTTPTPGGEKNESQ